MSEIYTMMHFYVDSDAVNSERPFDNYAFARFIPGEYHIESKILCEMIDKLPLSFGVDVRHIKCDKIHTFNLNCCKYVDIELGDYCKEGKLCCYGVICREGELDYRYMDLLDCIYIGNGKVEMLSGYYKDIDDDCSFHFKIRGNEIYPIGKWKRKIPIVYKVKEYGLCNLDQINNILDNSCNLVIEAVTDYMCEDNCKKLKASPLYGDGDTAQLICAMQDPRKFIVSASITCNSGNITNITINSSFIDEMCFPPVYSNVHVVCLSGYRDDKPMEYYKTHSVAIVSIDKMPAVVIYSEEGNITLFFDKKESRLDIAPGSPSPEWLKDLSITINGIAYRYIEPEKEVKSSNNNDFHYFTARLDQNQKGYIYRSITLPWNKESPADDSSLIDEIIDNARIMLPTFSPMKGMTEIVTGNDKKKESCNCSSKYLMMGVSYLGVFENAKAGYIFRNNGNCLPYKEALSNGRILHEIRNSSPKMSFDCCESIVTGATIDKDSKARATITVNKDISNISITSKFIDAHAGMHPGDQCNLITLVSIPESNVDSFYEDCYDGNYPHMDYLGILIIGSSVSIIGKTYDNSNTFVMHFNEKGKVFEYFCPYDSQSKSDIEHFSNMKICINGEIFGVECKPRRKDIMATKQSTQESFPLSITLEVNAYRSINVIIENGILYIEISRGDSAVEKYTEECNDSIRSLLNEQVHHFTINYTMYGRSNVKFYDKSCRVIPPCDVFDEDAEKSMRKIIKALSKYDLFLPKINKEVF